MEYSKQSIIGQSGDIRTGPEGGRNVATPASPARRLVPVSTKVATTLSDEIDAYAKARGITRSRAAGQYLAIASETMRGGDGVTASKAEEILEALEGVRTVVELLGPPAFGVMRLLSHWATQTGGLKVSEDELVAELRTVAADEWEQVLSEAERELHEAMRKAKSEGGQYMFFVEARYHRSPEKVPLQIRYISHREERLPDGQGRELFGIGDRYRAIRGDEKAIERAFAEDSRALRRPAYFRFILTVDNRTAERFARLDGIATERVIRDAIQKTFRGAARDVQGVFAIHQHGGHDRPAHPHVHALLSPRLQNGAPIHFSPRAIERVKERWHTEVLRALQSHERRLVARLPGRELSPLTPIRQRDIRSRQLPLPFERWSRPRRVGLQTLAFLRSRPSRRIGRLLGRDADGALALLDRTLEVNRSLERAARRAALPLLSRALPGTLRNALWLTRGIASIGVCERW